MIRNSLSTRVLFRRRILLPYFDGFVDRATDDYALRVWKKFDSIHNIRMTIENIIDAFLLDVLTES